MIGCETFFEFPAEDLLVLGGDLVLADNSVVALHEVISRGAIL